MTSLLEKFRVAVLSNAHKLIDAVIDLDNVGAVKQYVRDLEASLAELENGAAEAAGYVRTLTREKNGLAERSKQLDQTIDLILTDSDPNNDHLATAKQVELDGVNSRLRDVTADSYEAQATSRKLDEAVSALRSKHVAMVEQVRRLESLQRSAKAKEGAAKAVKMVGEMVKSGETVSVDSVIDRMRRQSDVADEKFDRAMNTLDTTTGKDVAVATANAKIEERKRRLATSKTS